MYVNAFCCAVPNANKEAYIRHASIFAEIIRAQGCQRYTECWGDDIPDGETTSFTKAVQARDNESIVLGWAEWRSKEDCEKGMAAAMQDERMRDMEMPFDGKRLIFGSFNSIIEV
ncbi:MAG: DUF1428 domain-containing protein [Ahrensia sp.]|nr:DUF1428 domain-containing protein [Ahrensia sp.]